MARPQRATRSQQAARQTSRYPQRQRATPAPLYFDFSRSSSAVSDLEMEEPYEERIRMAATRPRPRRATPAPSYSDITELSRSSSPSSDFAGMEVDEELDPEPWSPTPTTSEVSVDAKSFISSSASDDTVVAGPASAPRGFINMPRKSLRYPRRASSSSIEVSELTWLSRTPSRSSEGTMTPGELAEMEYMSEEETSEEHVSEEEVAFERRGANGRYVSKRMRPWTSSSDERPAKKTKVKTSRLIKKAAQLSSRTVLVPTIPAVTPNGGSFGTFAMLPQEIRQQIFAYTLQTVRPVVNRQCCGPDSTKRERDVCKTHGKSVAVETGRFNILQVSSVIKEEAEWVLYNQGSLKLELGKWLRPYFAKYRPKSLHRLGEIPLAKKVKAMWMTAARFRLVELSIPEEVLQLDNPEIYTENLCEIASLLLKAWEKESYQPTSAVPHAVTISLGGLFEETVPFNAVPIPDVNGELYLWSLINFPGQLIDFVKIATNSGRNFMRLISIVRHNKGLSKWKMVALSEIDEDSEGYKWLRGVRKECARGGLAFEGLMREEMWLT